MAKSSSSSDKEFPLPAQIYSPPKKDLSWTGLLEFVDDTVTDYSRPTPSIDASKCNKSELQSSHFSAFEHGESSDSIMSKPMIKFVKEVDCPRVIKTNNTENDRKSTVKYVEMYRNISKDNDYGGATQDRKSTTRGFQSLGRRLISWKFKKQTIVATSTTKAEYMAAASGCGQVLWIQNQMLDYGLISWQCKKQTIVATSTTEAEYVTTASGYGQVLWIQN
nr:putative ribonuclease H-like domain-containing protein [Tanacetum cinerariifolium]